MKTRVLQENILKGLLRVGRIIPAKPQLPVLANVLLEAESGLIRLTGTSLETTETITIGAKTESDGGLCVPAKILTEFISSLPQDTVEMSVDEGSLRISCAGYKATIPGTPATEFPKQDQKTGAKLAAIDKTAFSAAVRRVVFSAATDEGRPILTGIKMTQQNEVITFAATDGYRLTVSTELIKTSEPLDLLVPARALSEVLKVAADEKDNNEMFLGKSDEGQLTFKIGDTELRTRLIDGDFPDYGKIIPKKHNTSVIFEKEAFLRAVKAASIFARDSANIIRLKIDGSSATVSANTPQVGEDEVEIEVQTDGEGGEMAFNSRFLIEFLSNINTETVVFEMTGSLNPGVFKLPNDESFLHIIMPVRLQS